MGTLLAFICLVLVLSGLAVIIAEPDLTASERKRRREAYNAAWGESHEKMLDIAAIVVPTFAGFSLVCALIIFFTI